MFIRVDLPAPFSPSTPSTSPGASAMETSALARTPGYCLVIPESSSSSADLRQIGDLAGADVLDQLLDLRLVVGADLLLELAEAGEADAVLVESEQVVARLECCVEPP